MNKYIVKSKQDRFYSVERKQRNRERTECGGNMYMWQSRSNLIVIASICTNKSFKSASRKNQLQVALLCAILVFSSCLLIWIMLSFPILSATDEQLSFC